jgi:hypothetical protein
MKKRTLRSSPYDDGHVLAACGLFGCRWRQPLETVPRITVSIDNIQLRDQRLPLVVRYILERLVFAVPQEERRCTDNAVAQRERGLDPVSTVRRRHTRREESNIRDEGYVPSTCTSVIQQLYRTDVSFVTRGLRGFLPSATSQTGGLDRVEHGPISL